MAKMSLDSIIPLIKTKGSLDEPLSLLREIIILQYKLDNLDIQDFYFQKGKDNHLVQLNFLKEQYAQIVETVNGSSVDYFLEQVKEYEGKVQKLTSKDYLSTIDQIALYAVKSQISKSKNLLHIKGLFGKLKPLDELMKDEEMLMMIFNSIF